MKNGSYSINDPDNLHTFKTVKDAKAFLNFGTPPPAKLSKKEQAKADAERRKEEKAMAKQAKEEAAGEARNNQVSHKHTVPH